MKWSSQANVPAVRDIVYLSEADVSDMCSMGPACSHDTQVMLGGQKENYKEGETDFRLQVNQSKILSFQFSISNNKDC